MKKNIAIVILILFGNIVFAQNNKYISTIDITIYSLDFNSIEDVLNNYFKETKTEVVSFRKTRTNIVSEFYLNNEFKEHFDSIVSLIGYSDETELNTTNYKSAEQKLDIDIQYNEERKKEYINELELRKSKNEEYDVYWNEARKIESELFELKKQKESFKQEHDYLVTLKIYDDNVDLTRGAIKWVNMPGASYDMLFTENPTSGVSASIYQGVSLKYLFTRGKSYAKIGVVKGTDGYNDTLSIFTELFQVSFGQDFYTKHFGRGERKFLNLYSGYDVGGIIATGTEKDDTFLPFLKIHLGLELFKNKYLLFDNKVSYFVPFIYNRELRGLVYSASFNFVF